MSEVIEFSDHQSFRSKIMAASLYCADEHLEEVGEIMRDYDNPDLERLREIATGPAVQRKVMKHV